MTEKTNKLFVISFGIVFSMLVVFYACFFRYGVVKQQSVVPQTYKQLLLEEVKGPRVIVDSGSNGFHSIEGSLFEELSGYPTIILSDHAGSSFHDKIERLLKYAHEGDKVILPLEWNYYHYNDLGEVHLRTTLNEVSNYYWALPVFNQFFRAFQTPFKLVLGRSLQGEFHVEEDYFEEHEKLDFFHDHYYLNDPYGGAILSEEKVMDLTHSSCDDYIIPELAKKIRLSSDFKKSIRKLKKLRDNGVDVILIPPVVVGNDCYEKYCENLELLLIDAKSYLRKHKIPALWNYQDFNFDGEFIQDTHFHINEQARMVFTPTLVNELVDSGWLVPRDLEPMDKVSSQVPVILADKRLEMMSQKMTPWRGNPTEVYFGDDRGTFYFGSDWYEEDQRGRWAKEANVEVVFRPLTSEVFDRFYINAYYYNGTQNTKVYLNDRLVAEQDFTTDHVLKLARNLQDYLDERSIIRMRFESTGLVAPVELGEGSDIRKLKFGLHSLQLLGPDLP